MLYRKKVTVYIRNNLEKINDIKLYSILYTHARIYLCCISSLQILLQIVLNFYKPVKKKRKQNTNHQVLIRHIINGMSMIHVKRDKSKVHVQLRE